MSNAQCCSLFYPTGTLKSTFQQEKKKAPVSSVSCRALKFAVIENHFNMPARIRPSPLLPAEPVCFMLPLELQYHIIDLSLPLAEFASDDVNATGTHISRAVLLTSYSQVNRAWSSFSQSLLFRHVVLSTSSDVMKLRETLEQFPKFRELVRTIRSGNVNMQPITEGAQNSWIEIGEDFLKLCPWLEELRAAKCRVDLRGLMATPR